MSFTYRDYCRSVGNKPGMTEAQFNEAFGINTDSAPAPLQITPKNRGKIGDHCKVVNQIRETRSKRKKEAAKKPKAAKAPKEPKPKPTNPKKEKLQKEPKPKLLPRGKHSTLTEEERRELRNARAREYRKKRKVSRTYTPDQEVRRREYAKEYYERTKEQQRERRREYAKEYRKRMREQGIKRIVPPELRKYADFSAMTPEQIEAHKKAKSKERNRAYYQRHKDREIERVKKYKASPDTKLRAAMRARARRAVKKFIEATSQPSTNGTTTMKQCGSCAA